MRMNLPFSRRRVVGGYQRHMTIGALLRFCRIVKRARPLARNPRRLPVVVFIKAAEPAVAVYGNVQMDFVTARTELRRLVGVEALQESLAMRLRINVQQVIVRPSQELVFAYNQVVQGGIFDSEVALTHRALDMTIEWHEVQPSPFCASGVSICSLMGRSNRPLKNTA